MEHPSIRTDRKFDGFVASLSISRLIVNTAASAIDAAVAGLGVTRLLRRKAMHSKPFAPMLLVVCTCSTAPLLKLRAVLDVAPFASGLRR